ncbi:MAG: DUF4349 domain-containing protein [Polyangiaceae bacterium]|nr:DUF4349 domain-containing protein [Myxococcales bacterium]MCB9584234.1 DUF4349 domain-containing protein [Polyangiaceae bacterium]MCB9608603.1 DUF4349 domain-containing protein [Polyangiaceae bacterium]
MRGICFWEPQSSAFARLYAVLLLVLLLFGVGCGGASYAKEASMSPGEADYGGGQPQATQTASAGGDGMAEMSLDREEIAFNDAPVAPGAAPPAAPPGPQPPPAPPKAKPDTPGQPPVEPAGGKEPSDQTPQKVAGPLLIYRAEINMGVFQTREVIDKTEKMAREMGGYLVRRSDREIVIRVPSAKFREALGKVGGFGDVLHQNVEVEDVTEKFFDLQTRLKNMKAVRDRFQQLLTKANTVEDSLKIERELERVTTQIEVMEGRLKLMRELIAFSTITLRLEPQSSEHVAPKVNLPFDWLRKLGLPSLLSM